VKHVQFDGIRPSERLAPNPISCSPQIIDFEVLHGTLLALGHFAELADPTSVFASTKNSSTTNRSVSSRAERIPLGFEENQGLVDAKVDLPRSRSILYRVPDPGRRDHRMESGALRIFVAGANPAAKVSAEQQLPAR